jgi:ribosomal protein S18 acetylase RimI-like enzyme
MSAATHTDSFEEAHSWATELYGKTNFLDFWFPKSQFISASRQGNSMSASRKDAKNGLYGMALGALAPISPDWDHFSICRNADLAQINLDRYKEDGQWDAYQIQTKVHEELPPLENLNSPENHHKINQFLSGHFPDSSVKAGDPEVAAWAAMLDQENQIIAIGALSIWESGNLAAQSIAVDQNHRGQGLGKEFVKRLVSTANQLGYENMCLGVWHFNEVAKHVYESSGFHLIDRFIHYAQVDDPIKRTNRPVRE